MSMQKKIQIFIEQYHMIEHGDHVVVGVSGGADSVCLLLVLARLQKSMEFSLSAVHVEHGIRGAESLQDAEFVQELCERLQVPLRMFSVNAPSRAQERRQSLEEAARELRYECFYEACRQLGASRLAVAHHGDDCAETMLFHLSRGTGIRGLCGIVPVRHVAEQNVDLIRPLLCLTRTEIEEFLQKEQQEFRTDSTNADQNMSRNRIRSQVLPQLRQINPAAVPHMVRTAGYMEEVCAYIDEAAWSLGKQYIRYFPEEQKLQEIRIARDGFTEMPKILQENLLHRLLGELAGSRKDITAVHVEKVRELFELQVGRQINLPYQMIAEAGYEDICLYRKSETCKTCDINEDVDTQMACKTCDINEDVDTQTACKTCDINEDVDTQIACKTCSTNEDLDIQTNMNEKGKKNISQVITQKKRTELTLDISGQVQEFSGMQISARVFPFDGNFQQIPEKTYTKWFDYDRIKNAVQIRTRRPGDFLQVRAGGGHKKLKDYLIDSKIPQKERDALVLLADASHILWIVGWRISEAYKVTQETKRILEIYVNGGKEKNE